MLCRGRPLVSAYETPAVVQVNGLETNTPLSATLLPSWNEHNLSSSMLSLNRGSQYSEREWDLMKPIIRRIYLREGKTLEDVISTMSLVYHFKAR